MKKMMKQICCIIMVLFLCVSYLPYISTHVDAAGTGLTLAQLQQKFPHGKYWNHAGNPGASNSVNNQDGYTSTPCSQHNVVGTDKQTCNGFQPGNTQLSWQCMGYAEKLGYDVTGYNPRSNSNGWYTYTSSSALDNLKPGDIVRYKDNGHSIYVTGVNGDTVTYTDCNSDGHCIIRWNVTISKATLRSTFTHLRSAPSSPTQGTSYVDLGTDFFGVILNSACWKPISLESDGYVCLQSETGKSNQVWHFKRQDDGSYVISSAYDGKALEMYLGNTSLDNPVAAASEDWGGYYQRWYLIRQGNGYILLSKHYTNLNLVLNLDDNNTVNGTAITTYTRNNSDAQIWAIYSGDDVQLSGPTLKVNTGDSKTVTKFTWSEVYGESHYNLQIWKGTAWDGEAYHVEWDGNSGFSMVLPAGTYQAYVDAVNHFEYKMGNLVTFTVSEHKHSYNGKVTAPTCTAQGYTTYTCSSCGDTYKANYTNAKGHSEVSVKGYAATCTSKGLTDGKKCSVCGVVTVKQTEIAVKGHSYTSKVTAPTCTAQGYTTYICSSCGDTYKANYTNAKGHTEVTVKGYSATCTTKGLTDGKMCTVCDTVTVKQTEIAAKGHSYTSKVTAPTCTAQGYTTYTCSVCGDSYKSNYVSATGNHTYSNSSDATCNSCGYVRAVAAKTTPMYRMYNPNSGEHFYTGSTEERNILVNAGWKYEGVAFNFPVVGKPVYRLYEPKTGEHLYTMDENEKAKLLSEGWNYEGVAFNSAGENEVAQYRLHNPNATCGAYHFTGSKEERDILIAAGWEYQGIGWYSCLR